MNRNKRPIINKCFKHSLRGVVIGVFILFILCLNSSSNSLVLSINNSTYLHISDSQGENKASYLKSEGAVKGYEEGGFDTTNTLGVIHKANESSIKSYTVGLIFISVVLVFLRIAIRLKQKSNNKRAKRSNA